MILKIVLTILIVLLAAYTITRVWRIDSAAFLRAINPIKSAKDFVDEKIPVIDQSGIYQNGELVSKLVGNISQDSENKTVSFSQIVGVDGKSLNTDESFDYRGNMFKVISIQNSIGTMVTNNGNKMETFYNVYQGLTCKKIK